MSKQSSRGTAWGTLRQRVLDRDGWTCAYCGKTLTGSDATVDHITAKDNGGEDAEWNLAAACLACNGRKSNKTLIRMPWYNRNWLDALA